MDGDRCRRSSGRGLAWDQPPIRCRRGSSRRRAKPSRSSSAVHSLARLGVEDQVGLERVLVLDREVGRHDGTPPWGSGRGCQRTARSRSRQTWSGHTSWTSAKAPTSSRASARHARRGAVASTHDHAPGIGEELGGVRERAMGDLLGAPRWPRRAGRASPRSVVHSRMVTAAPSRSQPLGQSRGQRRLAAAGRPGEPEHAAAGRVRPMRRRSQGQRERDDPRSAAASTVVGRSCRRRQLGERAGSYGTFTPGTVGPGLGRRPRRCRWCARRRARVRSRSIATSSGQCELDLGEARRSRRARARARRGGARSHRSMTGTPASVSVTAMKTQRAVDDLALGLGVGRRAASPPRRIASSSSSRTGVPRSARRAAAARATVDLPQPGTPGDPDRPAHRRHSAEPRHVGRIEAACAAASDVARWARSVRSGRRQVRIPAGMREHQRAEGEERRQRRPGCSWSRLVSMYVVRKSRNSVPNGSATPGWPLWAALRIPKNR